MAPKGPTRRKVKVVAEVGENNPKDTRPELEHYTSKKRMPHHNHVERVQGRNVRRWPKNAQAAAQGRHAKWR